MGGFFSVSRNEEPLQVQRPYNVVQSEVNSGRKQARTELAAMMLLGIGDEADKPSAVNLLQECVNDGDSRAMWMLGLCYEFGMGVAQDLQKADKLYNDSARRGCGSGKLLAAPIRTKGNPDVMSFCDDDPTALYEALLVGPWNCLCYHICPLTDNMLIAVTDAMKYNTSVKYLDFSGSFVRTRGAELCAEMLKCNTTLTSLDLATGAIDDDGVVAIAEVLKTNTVLQHLTLYINNCHDEGAKSIADMVKVNTTLIELDLRNNSIGDEGGRALNEALQTNTSIIQLYLEHNQFGRDTKEAIRTTFLPRKNVNPSHFVFSI